MKQIVIILFFSIFFIKTHAQLNLVRNPSFEFFSSCPDSWDLAYYATGWTGIDSGWVASMPKQLCFPDYVNKCSTHSCCSAPSNFSFFQYPRTGNGMMQVRFYDDGIEYGWVVRDYLQGRLYHTLTGGQSYCVTFYVNMENRSAYAINHIGAYLDNGSIDTASHCDSATEYTPQILEDSIIRDTLGWIKVQGSFIATGNEKFITIGEFFDTAHISKIHLPSPLSCGVYLVDDVSVIASNATATAGPDTWVMLGDSTWIGVDSNGDGMPCYWYVLGGTTPIDSGGRIQVHPITTTEYVVEMDLCGTVTRDTVKVEVWPVGVSMAGAEFGEKVRLYPNPAGNEVTVEGVRGCEVRVIDLVGRCFVSYHCSEDVVHLPLAGLEKGMYFVEVVDKETGVRVVRKLVKSEHD